MHDTLIPMTSNGIGSLVSIGLRACLERCISVSRQTPPVGKLWPKAGGFSAPRPLAPILASAGAVEPSSRLPAGYAEDITAGVFRGWLSRRVTDSRRSIAASTSRSSGSVPPRESGEASVPAQNGQRSVLRGRWQSP